MAEFRSGKNDWKENGVTLKEELTALQEKRKVAKPKDKPALAQEIKDKEKEIREHETPGALTMKTRK